MQSIKDSINSLGYKEEILDKLEKNYLEAMKDDNFKELVVKLKLKKDVLQKYTSLLQTSALEYHNCKNCKSILECKNLLVGYAYLPNVKDGEISFKYRCCKYKKKLEEETKYLNNINVIGSNTYLAEAKMKDIYTNDKNRFKTIAWIKNFITNYSTNHHLKGLYLSGNFGCGKTYLISSMLNELAKKGYKSSVIFWPEFLRDLKSSFQSDYSYKYEAIKMTPILLIDDIGSEVTTSWSRDEILCPLMQYRMEHKLPTFFTSNLTIEQLKEHLSVTKDGTDLIKSSRIIERIKQIAEIQEIISKNLRD